MKTILLIVLGSILSLPASAQDRNAMTKTVNLWYDAFNKKEPAQFTQILSESWVDIPAAPGQPAGPKGLEKVLAELTATFPDFKVTPVDILQDGDKVIVRSEITG